MKKFKIRERDYTGCHPDIAEALKNGVDILCDVVGRNKPEYITRYVKEDLHNPYTSYEGYHYKEATPVEAEQIVKPASEIVKWLEVNDWVLGEQGWRGKVETGGYVNFPFEMLHYCGKKPALGYWWHEDWLTLVEPEQ